MRLIDADALKSDIAKLKESPWFNTKAGYAYRKEAIIAVEILCVDKAPTVDPVRHGNWVGIRRGNDFMRLELECDVCGAVFYTNSPIELAKFHYCPQCGTRMDEIQITWID